MSESQKRIAKRLFEILKQMGYIKETSYQYPFGTRFDMSLSTEKNWIQVLTEAIAIFQGEELEKELKLIKAKVKRRKQC